MPTQKPKCNCLEIVRAIENHARGKLTSRFVLACERIGECIQLGSPQKAIKEQDLWLAEQQKDYELKKLAKKQKKKKKK